MLNISLKILFFLLLTRIISFSQGLTITSNQEILIKRKAIGNLKDFEFKLNQILESDIEEREIIISNTILPSSILTSTFLSDQVIIEDDFETRKEVEITLNKTVENYLRDIGLYFGKKENGEFINLDKKIKFYDIKTDKIFTNKSGQMYLKINFKVNFQGRDLRSGETFKSGVSRVAEFLIISNGSSFSTTINGISFKNNLTNQNLDLVTVINSQFDSETKKYFEEIDQLNLTSLSVISNQKEAKVFINDKEIGLLKNYSFQTLVKPSMYKIRLENQIYSSNEGEYFVKNDSLNEITIKMFPIKSIVNFKIKPEEFYLEVNGLKINSLLFIVEKNSLVNIKVKKIGFEDLNEQLQVIGDTFYFERNLKPILKEINFFSKTNNVKYNLNNSKSGFLPYKDSYSYGHNTITFSKKGFFNEDYNFLVNESKSEIIEIQLKKDLDYFLKKEVGKQRSLSVLKFFINSSLLYFSYYNFQKFSSELDDLKATQTTFSDSDKKDQLQIYQYLSGGGVLVFSIGSIKNLISSFYVNKQKIKNNLK